MNPDDRLPFASNGVPLPAECLGSAQRTAYLPERCSLHADGEHRVYLKTWDSYGVEGSPAWPIYHCMCGDETSTVCEVCDRPLWTEAAVLRELCDFHFDVEVEAEPVPADLEERREEAA